MEEIRFGDEINRFIVDGNVVFRKHDRRARLHRQLQSLAQIDRCGVNAPRLGQHMLVAFGGK